jgi:TolB protein
VFSDGTVKLAWGDWDSTTGDQFLTVVNVFDQNGPALGEAVRIAGSDLLITEREISRLDWSAPVVLPDGTESVRVAFIHGKSIDETYRVSIFIVNLIYDPGTGTFIVDPFTPPVVLDPGPGFNYWTPRFSPDGTLLTWHTGAAIWLANSDGTDQRVLIEGPGSVDTHAAWSPDGSKLAFVSDRDGGRYNIYVASLVYDAQGDPTVESIERVTDTKNKARFIWLSWSPDAMQMAFYDQRMRKLIVATGKVFTLADGRYPDWSPMDLPPLP